MRRLLSELALLFCVLFFSSLPACSQIDSLEVMRDSVAALQRRVTVLRDSLDSLSSRLSATAQREQPSDTVLTEAVSPSRYDLRVHRYRRNWGALIPTQIIVQNAGNMGYMSLGFGWDYGRRRQWETHLLWGFIPKYDSSRPKLTMTVKETYIPFSIYLGKGFALEPLSTGLYVNTVYGHEFWRSQPGRYPVKYYDMLSTKFRFNIFMGQRLTMRIPNNRRLFVKSISAFYELSTCDLYVRSMFQDSSIKLWDIIGLSLGLKFQLL